MKQTINTIILGSGFKALELRDEKKNSDAFITTFRSVCFVCSLIILIRFRHHESNTIN